jgi:hypothetical protein
MPKNELNKQFKGRNEKIRRVDKRNSNRKKRPSVEINKCHKCIEKEQQRERIS